MNLDELRMAHMQLTSQFAQVCAQLIDMDQRREELQGSARGIKRNLVDLTNQLREAEEASKAEASKAEA